ncbi:type VI secretion system tip protein VgrG [Pseudomonas sp. MPR-ANC1]|uniref:type VI secretion system Vgr family protein n=1 Tax=Pseudomonas sp. MPR-ANC1 TaxID=2075548 RepID=UPI000CD24F7D|nr:type VI secretion system tip protein TssI/VgrG [Pseudomonas sp. MPR-ANC1]POA46651.1 type VI secretion system tip protein VgrG [Pseudomonas sp. MPR-ANC1]
MLNDKESPFTLTLTDSGLCLPVLRFHGEEALNQPYRFDIELIGLAPAVTPGALLQQPVFLRLNDQHGIHGVVRSASCEHRGTHRIGYRLVVVPALQKLAQPSKRRVFVQLSVPQILQQLLDENTLPDDGYRIEMTVGHYPARPFCIQFDESDLALLHRLCEEEGIHYHFEHRADSHIVVFADDSLSLPQEPALLPFTDDAQVPLPSVSALYQHHHAAPIATLHAVRNRGPQASREAAANQTPANAQATLPSLEQRHSEQRSRRHLERQRCQHRSINGRSDCIGLLSGHLLQVTEHPINSFNEQWRITSIRHQGQHPSILDPRPSEHRYHNDFTAQPWSSDFRPPLKQPRPGIAGYHLAQVLGATGHPARLDEQGRVAVRLWPAQPSSTADSDAIWLPVAMTRANGRVAPDDLPCAGSEVWVSFLDGDPDRPILCLGTQRNPPPHKTPPLHDDSLLLDWLLNQPHSL